MAANVTFEPATVAHAEALAATIRPADALECEAFGYATPRDALVASVRASDKAVTVRFDGEVAFIFGVTADEKTLLGGPLAGSAWFLTGCAVDAHKRDFLRTGRQAMRALLDYCPVLVNWVDCRYVGALRFLAWLGAELGPEEPFGPLGLPFRRAVVRRGA